MLERGFLAKGVIVKQRLSGLSANINRRFTSTPWLCRLLLLVKLMEADLLTLKLVFSFTDEVLTAAASYADGLSFT